MNEFCLGFHWSLFLRFESTILQHWFRKWLGADQATCHYLNQWWLVYWRIYASLGLNELIRISISTVIKRDMDKIRQWFNTNANIYSAKKETHMWFNRNFFRYGVYMTETTIYDWNQQFVRNQNLFVNLLLCETGVCSGPLSATRSITCVATSCFLHCSASAWHGWNQTCNLCMWDVIPGLLDSQTQLWEGLRRWVTWPYASINKVPQMLDRGQVGGICWPGQYLDSISSQKVLCEAGRVRASIILLKR